VKILISEAKKKKTVKTKQNENDGGKGTRAELRQRSEGR
jgi:hypothetical protein